MLSQNAVQFIEFDQFHSSISRILQKTSATDSSFIGNYVNQFINSELEDIVSKFLIKSKKTNLIIGLNQVYRNLDKIKMVIIAKNIRDHDQEIARIVSSCHKKQMNIVFACTRNKLSHLFNLNYGISCIGVKYSIEPDQVSVIQEMIIQNRIIWRLNYSALSNITINSRNEGPIWISAFYGFNDQEILTELQSKGWDINEPDSFNGFTPLMISIERKHSLWTEWLVEAKADLELRCFTGENCLSLSISSNSFTCFCIIVDNGLKTIGKKGIMDLIQQKNFSGESCIDIARSNGNHAKFINYLSNLGIKV